MVIYNDETLVKTNDKVFQANRTTVLLSNFGPFYPFNDIIVYEWHIHNQGGESRGLNDRARGISWRYSYKTC